MTITRIDDPSSQSLTLRVYYEDTDFSGRVYHASYLRFCERGRTEWLRAAGFSHAQLAASQGLSFAVTDLSVSFKAPAFIDEELQVTTLLQGLKGPLLIFYQTITRDSTLLILATVHVVTLQKNRAVRPPREIVARIRGE